MSKPSDHFSSASDAYRQFRPSYPIELFQYLADLAPQNSRAWDCGCGNGQASAVLAEHFQRVDASDMSAAQVAEAIAKPNLHYHVSPAEMIEAEDQSLDLITVAQAIHWFDHPRFFNEVNRTLKPGGVLATWGYQLLYTDTALDEFIGHFHSQVVGPYWPPGRELLDEHYSRIPFPYPRLTPPQLRMEVRWNFSQLLGYLNTWSAVKYYQQDKGVNPVELHRHTLLKHWGRESRVQTVYWPLLLYVGQKPTRT